MVIDTKGNFVLCEPCKEKNEKGEPICASCAHNLNKIVELSNHVVNYREAAIYENRRANGFKHFACTFAVLTVITLAFALSIRFWSH